MKYCLDTTVLEEYMDFRSSLDCYLRIEKKLSQCLEELSDSTIDLQSLLSLLRSFNKRQNLLANQPYISEFRNEEEAINDSWHQMFTTLKNMKPLYQRTFPDDKEPYGLDKYSEDDFCDIFDDKDFMWEEEQ